MSRTLSVAAVVIAVCGFLPAQQFNVLYTFPKGWGPVSTLAFDKAGNLYGTTMAGGSTSCFGGLCGTVFELSPNSNGTWTETTLYSFTGAASGYFPVAGLAIDSSGNLYGTTQQGGGGGCYPDGCGLAFELSPPSVPGGNWNYTIIHTFCSAPDCADGAIPRYGTLTFDGKGNLYGTTQAGGTGTGRGVDGDNGVVFELSPGIGGWTETVLYNFCSDVGQDYLCLDGNAPQSGVTFDRAGNLYGTTLWGGRYATNYGLIFKLSPGLDGWTETTLYAFPPSGIYGSNPMGPVAFDGAGNVYTTFSGEYGNGQSGVGRMARGGRPSEIFLDGLVFGDIGVLIDGKRRVLYGATGANLYEIDQSGSLTVLYSFEPFVGATGSLIEDSSGNLYGPAYAGNDYNGNGEVFEYSP